MEEASQRAKLSADSILEELGKLAFLNMDDYMRIGEDGDPFVDLTAATRAQKAGLIAFKCKDYLEGRGEDARMVREVEIKLNTSKFSALVKLGEHVGLFGKIDPANKAGGEEAALAAQIIADDRLRRERMTEIAERYGAAGAPKKIEKAKETVSR